MEKMMDAAHSGGINYSSYERTYDYDGMEKKEPTEWEAKAKLAETALIQIVNLVGSARECKKIADDALTILNRR